MVYDPNEPQLDEGYSTAQPLILENFSQADTVFGVDHVGFTPATPTGGDHDTVRLIEQVDVPDTDEDEAALYCFDDPDFGLTACFRDEDNGASVCIGSDREIGFAPIAVAAVLFNSAGAIVGSALNVASVVGSGVTPVEYTITFTSAIPSNCSGQVSFNFLSGPNIVPPSVFSVTTTEAVINWIGPLSAATFGEMSVIIWSTP